MEKNFKKRLIRRIKIIEGQVRGLERLVEKEAYCIDIIVQTSAVRHALSSIEDLLLENHLKVHVGKQMRTGEEKRAISEILDVYRVSKKK